MQWHTKPAKAALRRGKNITAKAKRILKDPLAVPEPLSDDDDDNENNTLP